MDFTCEGQGTILSGGFHLWRSRDNTEPLAEGWAHGFHLCAQMDGPTSQQPCGQACHTVCGAGRWRCAVRVIDGVWCRSLTVWGAGHWRCRSL